MSKEAVRKLVGQNIRKERTSRNLSIEELAELVGRTPGFIGLVERGKRGATAELLTELSEIFGLSSGTLLHSREKSILQVAEVSRGKNEGKAKRAAINSLLYDFKENELDFIITVIKSFKKIQAEDQAKDSLKKEESLEEELGTEES